MIYVFCMKDKKHIFYCRKFNNKDAIKFCKEHGIELERTSIDGKMCPLVFIDLDGIDKVPLNGVLDYVKDEDNVVVVVRKLSDLGTGAKSKKIQLQIKALGGEVFVPKKILRKRGPKLKGEIPRSFVVRAKELYDNRSNSRQYVCDVIFSKTGVKLTRFQLRNRFE